MLGVARRMTKCLTPSSVALILLSVVVFATGLYVYDHRVKVCGDWLGLYIAIGGSWIAVLGGVFLAATAYLRGSKILGACSLLVFLLAGIMYVVVGSISSACSGV